MSESNNNFFTTALTKIERLLFQDEFGERPRISKVLNSISNYSSTIQNAPDDPNQKAPEKANLGTLMGVYLPCLQNIFGVILFIRMTWLVGTCGAVEGFLVILICCCTVSFICILNFILTLLFHYIFRQC